MAVADDVGISTEVSSTGRHRDFAARFATPSTLVLLLGGMVAEFLLRFIYTLGRHGPFLMADEMGYLANGRVISGGASVDMTNTTFYYGGYGIFLAPAYWISHNPAVTFHAALIIGAIISTMTFPLVYGLMREIGLGREVALLAGLAASLSPDLLFSVSLTLSENLLTPLLVAWVWTAVRLVKNNSTGRRPYYWAGAHAVTLGLLVATHPRGLVIACAGIVLLVLLSRWIGLGASLIAVGGGLVLMAGALGLNIWLMHVNWPSDSWRELIPASGSTASGTAGRLNTTLSFTAGQLWYACVASACLVPLGFFYILLRLKIATGVTRFKTAVAFTFALFALIICTAGSSSLLSGAAPGTLLASHLVYGRYVAVTMPIFIGWGVAGLMETRLAWRRVAWLPSLALVGIFAFWTYEFAGARLLKLAVNPLVIPTVLSMTHPFVPAVGAFKIHLPRTTAVAIACLVLLMVLINLGQKLRWVAVVAAMAMFVTWSGFAYDTDLQLQDAAAFPGGKTAMQIPAVTHAKRLSWDTEIASTGNIQWKLRYAFYAERGVLKTFDSKKTAPAQDADVVVADPSWVGTNFGYTLDIGTPSIKANVWTRD